MSGMRQKIQYSLALEPAHQGETPVGGCQGTEPVVVKPAPQSPALASTPCRCPSLTPSNRRVRDPYARWCGGAGTQLIDAAKTTGVGVLELWCFQANERARRFYEARGFRAIRFTDGADNEERMPDIRYRWER